MTYLKNRLKGISIAFLFTLNALVSYCQTTIHMMRQDGAVLIPCFINELPANFTFDSLASEVSISVAEVSFLLKNGFLNDSNIINKGYYTSDIYEVKVGDKLNLKTLTIGFKTLYNVQARISQQQIPLSLDLSTLNEFGPYTLDYSNKLFVLTKDENSTNLLTTQTQYYYATKAAFDSGEYKKTIEIARDYINAFPYQPQGYSFLVRAAKALDPDTTKGLATSAIFRQIDYLMLHPEISKQRQAIFNGLYYLLVYYAEHCVNISRVDRYKRLTYLIEKIKEIFPDPESEEFKFAESTSKQLSTYPVTIKALEKAP